MADQKPYKLKTSQGILRPFETGDTIPVIHGGTGLSTVSAGALLYASSLDTIAVLPASVDGYVLTLVSGAPAWAAAAGGGGADKIFRSMRFC